MINFSKYKMPKIPISFNFSGDRNKARSLVNYAKQQMNRMLEINSANKFNSLINKIQKKHFKLVDGSEIIIQINHGLSKIHIYSPIIFQPETIIFEPEVITGNFFGMVNYFNTNSAIVYGDDQYKEFSYGFYNFTTINYELDTHYEEDYALWQSLKESQGLKYQTKLIYLEVDRSQVLKEDIEVIGLFNDSDIINLTENPTAEPLDYFTSRIGPEIEKYGHTEAIKFYVPVSQTVLDGVRINYPTFFLATDFSIEEGFNLWQSFLAWLDENNFLYELIYYNFRSLSFLTNPPTVTGYIFSDYLGDTIYGTPMILDDLRWLKILSENSYWNE